LVFFDNSHELHTRADNVLSCMFVDSGYSSRDDGRVEFRVYVQKRSRLSWMSASLLLRNLGPNIMIVWYPLLDDYVWYL